MTHEILTALEAYLSDAGRALARFLPRLLAALLMLLVGFLVAFVLRAITRLGLRWLRFNALMERTGARQFMQRAQLGEPDHLVASLVFWLTWFVLVLTAMRTLGVAAVDALAHDVVRYLPKLVSAVLIIVLGVFLSTVAWRAALLAAVNARIPAPKTIGVLVRALTLVAVLAMALEQLAIGRQVVLTAFAISFGAIMLALAIAFGFGGRHLARRYLEQRVRGDEREPRKSREEPSHL
jgi:small-conductance mechanosensitive channel